ncbi:hypothetical protein AbraCBS73388_004428 [Aspergillus brasiliensis]|uniref:Uncharacterized protein n=1 Tax=Aspergillus brasiliensis TaxID=319629 RepID=A0A9W6DTX1_9EURO|nr:hypothetical protein AbraCBS73388_004428 [Aspergillus brasiliensis]
MQAKFGRRPAVETYIRRVTAKEISGQAKDQNQPTSVLQAHVRMVERDKPKQDWVAEKIQRSVAGSTGTPKSRLPCQW